MIERKKKICIGCGHPAYIYAHKLCLYCYSKERMKNAHTTGRVVMKRKVTGEAEMFEQIWAERTPHVSAVSNKPISNYEYTTRKCFAHIIPKKNFPRYRLKMENIEYLTWSEHTFWDNRTEEELKVRLDRGEDWKYMLMREADLKASYPNEF